MNDITKKTITISPENLDSYTIEEIQDEAWEALQIELGKQKIATPEFYRIEIHHHDDVADVTFSWANFQ